MSISEAARLLLEGRLVAFPTETVYGLGGDATNERAVAAIFEAKGRPRFNPLISHVLGPDDAETPRALERHSRQARRALLAGTAHPGAAARKRTCPLRCWRRPGSTPSRYERRRIPWRRR